MDNRAIRMPTPPKPSSIKPLRGVRVLSLALNVPGPATMMRLRAMGATCTKLEPPAGDPMARYNPDVFATVHRGVKLLQADLRTPEGRSVLSRELARSEVLLTSFRPAALASLGLGWKALHKEYPGLSQVAIVGAPGERAQEAGHDLTYMAEAGLLLSDDMPATLYADMGGALMAAEAVLGAVLQRHRSGRGIYSEVALSAAAAWLALPRSWGMTLPDGPVGGGHAGYRIYGCKDGRVAVAALEPHFAAALCKAAGVQASPRNPMMASATHAAIAAFFAGQTCGELQALAVAQDIPLRTLALKPDSFP